MKKSYLIGIVVILALVLGYCLYKHKAHEHPGEALHEHPGQATTEQPSVTEVEPAAPEEAPTAEAPTQ